MAAGPPMTTRHCASCGEDKTIRGVWYMVPEANPGTSFVCETCFSVANAARAAVAQVPGIEAPVHVPEGFRFRERVPPTPFRV